MGENDTPASAALEPRSMADIDAPITGGEIGVLFRLAKGLALSGMFKDARQAEQAFAKLIFGRDLGVSATAAMTGIHIVEGKPEMSANLQAAKVKGSGKYDYRVLKLDNEECSIEFGLGEAPRRNGDGEWLPWSGSLGVSDFAMRDAVRAGLVLRDGEDYKAAPKKSTGWVFYPRNMLFARAMSNGVAFHCPDVTNGIRVYAEGEVVQAVAVETSEEPADAEVVSEPTSETASDHITPEQLAQLTESLQEAGVDDNTLTMLLTSVGVDCTEDLTQDTLAELLKAIGAHITRNGSES